MRLFLRRHVHELVERQAARPFPPARLAADPDPGHGPAASPARPLVAPGDRGAGPWHLLLVHDDVGPGIRQVVESFPQQSGARLDGIGWLRTALDDPWQRGALELDPAQVARDVSGMNGIQFSGTV